MPTYDYKCADCGRIFEKFHGMSEQPEVECPGCHSLKTARQVSLGAGIVFKGAGFYVNDYKKSDSASSGAAKTKTETKSETASATAESKPAHSCGPGCAHG